jgi:hypothetical protein
MGNPRNTYATQTNRLRIGHNLLPLLTILFLFFALAPNASAQKDTGSILGTVRDSTGAVVPDAKVTVTNVDEGIPFTTSTNSSGEYVATPLKIGRYTVTIERQGFNKVTIGPVELQVQQRLAVDATLVVGSVTQVVEVTGAVPQLETQNSEMGQVVGTRQAVELPLNGRNVAQLALLTAGVTPSEPGQRNDSNYGFSANGARSLQNNIMLDGMDDTSIEPDLLNFSNYIIMPSVDALQEFKVQTSDYSAEFGRGNGAIMNATIKSGTNDLHGVLYEFLRNDKLDSRNFFDATRPPYRQNQFGGTLGGPVTIPHVYDGRNRSFFFVDYEGLRIRQAETLTNIVPTLDQRNGDYQALIDYASPIAQSNGAPVLDCNGAATYAGELFNTRLTQTSGTSPTGLCGVPFAYDASGRPLNQIPSKLIDPLATRLTPLFPPPNVSNPAYNFLVNPILNEDRNSFDVRIDHRFSDRDTSFYRFSYVDQPKIVPAPFESTGGDGGSWVTDLEHDSARSFVLSETHIFNPSFINEFRAGYSRLYTRHLQFNYDLNLSAELGFPGVPFGPRNGGLPSMSFSDVGSLGSPGWLPGVEYQNVFNYSDNLTLIRGKHSLKFGTEIRPEEFPILEPAFSRGYMSFGPQFTDNAAAPGTGGSGFASFLLGVPEGGGINNIHTIYYERATFGSYVQDDYRVLPRLTLNLGLRYEIFTTVKEKHNHQATYDLAKQMLLIPAGQKAELTPTEASFIPMSATATPGLIAPDLRNFAPRLGFAYNLAKRVVVRGGYGIFYGADEIGPYSNGSQGYSPPFDASESYPTLCSSPSANPALSVVNCANPQLSVLSQGFPANALSDPNTPSLYTVPPNLPTPYVQQWHLSTQYQLSLNTLLEIGYAGSKGTNLYSAYNANQAAPTADPSIPYPIRRPIPELGNTGLSCVPCSGVNSDYSGLNVRVERRFSQGLSFLAAYTWSHSLDEASNASTGTQNNSGWRWSAHPEWEYGNSDFDMRQRLAFSYTYELPFGHGKHFLSGVNGKSNQLVSGWEVSGITTIQSGVWFTALDGNGNFANSDGSQHPDQIANPSSKPCLAGTFFNTCAFVNPALGSFGNAGRNTILGPGSQNWDFSVLRGFQLGERFRLQFRAEAFNLTNHANLLFTAPGLNTGNSSDVLGAPQFGYLTAARPARQIQFGLKLYY